jgi:hypothetical protein
MELLHLELKWKKLENVASEFHHQVVFFIIILIINLHLESTCLYFTQLSTQNPKLIYHILKNLEV